MTVLYVFSSLGGGTAFVVAIVVVIRAVTGQVSAVRDNTAAVKELSGKMTGLSETVNKHSEDIAFLKGRQSR